MLFTSGYFQASTQRLLSGRFSKKTLQYDQEETELGEVLLLFSPESFVFQFAFQICEDSNIRNQKHAWCFV
jgi:hypothetical protein